MDRIHHSGCAAVALKKLIIVIAALPIAGLLCFGTHASAQPNKVLERCGKQAAEVFRREYSSGSKTKDGMMFNYENHYSARLNKCFFLQLVVYYEKGKLTATKDMRLFENKEFGSYMDGFCDGCRPILCEVQEKVCRSESEWRQLLKPFMED
jgi:hypothetical protein